MNDNGTARTRDLLVLKCGGAVAADAAEGILAFAEASDVVSSTGPARKSRRRCASAGSRSASSTAPATDAEALDVVRESLAEVNAELFAAIGPRAVGFLGDELGLEARQVSELGSSETHCRVAPRRSERASAGSIPVIAPLAKGPLNVNADEAAVALAAGLGAGRILFVKALPGLLSTATSSRRSAPTRPIIFSAKTFEGGIVPKLEAAVRAARLGMRAEIGGTAVTG